MLLLEAAVVVVVTPPRVCLSVLILMLANRRAVIPLTVVAEAEELLSTATAVAVAKPTRAAGILQSTIAILKLES